MSGFIPLVRTAGTLWNRGSFHAFATFAFKIDSLVALKIEFGPTVYACVECLSDRRTGINRQVPYQQLVFAPEPSSRLA